MAHEGGKEVMNTRENGSDDRDAYLEQCNLSNGKECISETEV